MTSLKLCEKNLLLMNGSCIFFVSWIIASSNLEYIFWKCCPYGHAHGVLHRRVSLICWIFLSSRKEFCKMRDSFFSKLHDNAQQNNNINNNNSAILKLKMPHLCMIETFNVNLLSFVQQMIVMNVNQRYIFRCVKIHAHVIITSY